ncbi:MAG: PAS domain-containing protein [Candidatus Korobacteraceae bacterium]|jgi:PAS domain-containing protein
MTFSENTYYRTILNSIPIPVFVVDSDVRIRDLNDAAIRFCGQGKDALYRQSGGEVLHCVHSQDVPEGCGRAPFCQNCVIRGSVTTCLQGQKVSRKRTKIEFVEGASRKPMDLLVTVSPMPDSGEPLALLMIEDVTELFNLRALVPICMKCKKIRDDEQYWHEVEQYFHDQVGVDFSHGICPACVKQFYGEYSKQVSE